MRNYVWNYAKLHVCIKLKHWTGIINKLYNLWITWYFPNVEHLLNLYHILSWLSYTQMIPVQRCTYRHNFSNISSIIYIWHTSIKCRWLTALLHKAWFCLFIIDIVALPWYVSRPHYVTKAARYRATWPRWPLAGCACSLKYINFQVMKKVQCAQNNNIMSFVKTLCSFVIK